MIRHFLDTARTALESALRDIEMERLKEDEDHMYSPPMPVVYAVVRCVGGDGDRAPIRPIDLQDVGLYATRESAETVATYRSDMAHPAGARREVYLVEAREVQP